MRKDEFIAELRETLDGQVPEPVVNENVNYYTNYINGQIMQGVSEEQVIASLGSARLIARTIIDSASYSRDPFGKENSHKENAYYEKNSGYYGDSNPYSDSYAHEEYTKPQGIWGKIKSVLAAVVVVIVLALIICAVFSLFTSFFPFIIMILCIASVIRLIRDM